MTHDPIHTITTAAQPSAPNPYPVRTAMLPHEIPPGVQEVTLPGGYRTLAYTQPPAPATPAQPVSQPIPRWAKTTALLAPTVGGGIGAAGVGISYAAPGLIAMSHALWSAAALIATSALAAALLAWCARSAAPTQITQHVTATGLFGHANGTINH